jgi:hypothetical protein
MSAETKRACRRRHALRRNPNDPPETTLDFRGYNFWLNKLESFSGSYIDAEMVKSFLVSGEYRQRFGP